MPGLLVLSFPSYRGWLKVVDLLRTDVKICQEIKAETGRIVPRVKALATEPPRKHVCINNNSIINRLFLGFLKKLIFQRPHSNF